MTLRPAEDYPSATKHITCRVAISTDTTGREVHFERLAMKALKSAPVCLYVALTMAFLLPSAIADAQPGSGAAPSWASDQAAADADMGSGQYQDALVLYERAIATAQSGQPDAATNAAISKMLVNKGNCLLKLHRVEDAEAAYEKAAPLSPSPGTAYFNLCATYYNAGNTAAALVACDKAIEADPGKADAYFVKGSLLIANSTMDKNNRLVVPQGTVETLQKYLQLAPNGVHVKDVREMLDYVEKPSK